MKASLLIAASVVLWSTAASATLSNARKVVTIIVFNADGSAQVDLDGPITTTCSDQNSFRLTNPVAISQMQMALLSGKSVKVDTVATASPPAAGNCAGGLDNARFVSIL